MVRKRFFIVGLLVCLLVGLLVWGARAEGPRVEGVEGVDGVEGVLLGGMLGRDGSVAILRGEGVAEGRVLIFLDFEGGGSVYSSLLGEVPGPVEGGLLLGCGEVGWVVLQAGGRVYRWPVEGGEAWVCGVQWEVFLPAVQGGGADGVE